MLLPREFSKNLSGVVDLENPWLEERAGLGRSLLAMRVLWGSA